MWIKIQAGFSCLLMLVLPWNLVFLPVFDQLCPGLMIGESDAIFHALEMEIQNCILRRPSATDAITSGHSAAVTATCL